MSLNSKKIGMIVTATLILFSSSVYTALGADSYEIDPAHSMVVFRVSHLGISQTYGRFNQPEGTLRFDNESPKNSAIDIKVKVDNIDTDNEKRDLHLKSADFFDAEKYPDITFKSKRVTPKKMNHFEILGDLTLHGVTHEIVVTAVQTGAAKDPWGGYRIGFETVFDIKRSDFKMQGMQGAVGDEVQLTVSVEGIRK